MQREQFLGGIVEGFYGRPWTPLQRMQLFELMSVWGLDTYFYAPKDDLKHRALWRQPYTDTELTTLRALLAACRKHGLHFIYGLSPGLDIQFTNAQDREYLRLRIDQLFEIGCEHFALLFDDLPGQLTEGDRRAFASVAAAQADVTNDIYSWLKTRSSNGRFLFCPTPYCGRMDNWRLGGEGYLETIGHTLNMAIDVLWTGPEIVSREIPIESVQGVAARIGRQPLIWDNLHANDYDGRRLYTGPYTGRSPELKQHVAGILVNPNNEFVVNYVPLKTFAAYLHADVDWKPRDAFLAAIADWLPAYATCGDTFSMDELILLADCFYLPYEDGESAQRLYEVLRTCLRLPTAEWGATETTFKQLNSQIQTMFDKLTQLTDRELFYAWSRRAWDLKEELQLFDAFLARKKAGDLHPRIETHLPDTYRGGFVARLQRLLCMDHDGCFAPNFRSDQNVLGLSGYPHVRSLTYSQFSTR